MATEFPELSHFFESNSEWADKLNAEEPTFLEDNLLEQHPSVIWFGCSDSRIPESVILGKKPGDVLVHRNVSGIFPAGNDSANTTLEYGVNTLGINHIIIGGHTQCGGIQGTLALSRKPDFAPDAKLSHVQKWLQPWIKFARTVDLPEDPAEAVPKLTLASVQHSIDNIAETDTVQKAWAAGRKLYIHGWLYQLENGKIIDLGLTRSS